MLVSVTFNNAFIFSHEEQFSLKADLRSKKLLSNVIETEEGDNVLKSACIYGPNNSGKTCLVKVLRAIGSVILNQPGSILPNLFTDNPVVAIGCRFLEDNEEWEYTFKLDFRNTVFVYEKFSRIDFDVHHNEKPTVYYERDFEKNFFFSKDEKLQESLTLMGKNNILLHVVDSTSLPYLQKAKNILTKFASRIIIVDMNNIPLDQTIEILKNHDNIQDDIVSFIKNADLDLEDFKYLETNKIQAEEIPLNMQQPSEEVIALKLQKSIEDSFRLVSVYKGQAVPSLLFDSTGTKKIAALASYVVSALKYGHILVIDELDSSIHFKLTRSIVSMFNNELNDRAQLIFTAHDVSLMDCKKLFRKEQIWFVHKDEERAYVYSLAVFTAQDGVRDTTDLLEKYKRGVLGAVPEPDMLETLLRIKNE